MARRTLADEIQHVIMSRAPHEIKHMRREKSEGTSKHPRVKAMHVETQRIRFRVQEPGRCDDIHVVSVNTLQTVAAVSIVLKERNVPIEVIGNP